MSTTETGRLAEAAASTYLEMRGFTIIERNWRRPRCEIDIIARKGDDIYFVEAKYRKNGDQGGGLEAITATKMRQMMFATEMWVEESKWAGSIHLSAIELADPHYSVMHFIEDVF